MGFWENPWFVGIGAGILSGLIVWGISYKFIGRREDKVYLNRVRQANDYLIYSLRSTISEDCIPNKGIIESMRESTRRKFEISDEDTFSVKEIGEELIREVMDSSFISDKQKKEYCINIQELLINADRPYDGKRPALGKTVKKIEDRGYIKVNGKTVELIDGQKFKGSKSGNKSRLRETSLMIALMAGMTTATLSIATNEGRGDNNTLDGLYLVIIPTLMSTMALIATYGFKMFDDLAKIFRPPSKNIKFDKNITLTPGKKDEGDNLEMKK